MIDGILGNRTNLLVLRFLSKFDNQFFLPEEIAKETGAGLRNVHDALRTLFYEHIIYKKSSGRAYYKFTADSYFKELLFKLFEEERKRLFLKNLRFYKLISELESKIVKIAGSALAEIILFGSLAKGRDTINSDIDLCVLLSKKEEITEQKIKRMALDSSSSREVQIQVFTLEEFLAGHKNRNPLIENIIRDGLSLKMGK